MNPSESELDELVQFAVDGNEYDLTAAIINFAPESEFCSALRALVSSYYCAINGKTKEDRELSLAVFHTFSTSFASICADAARLAIIKGHL